MQLLNLNYQTFFREFPDTSGVILPDHSHGTGSAGYWGEETGVPTEVFDPDDLSYDGITNVEETDDQLDIEVSQGPIELDADQLRTVQLFTAYCFHLSNCKPGETVPPPHIFLTGPAGTGKSKVVNNIIEVVNHYSDDASGFKIIKHGGVYITASTGVAARQFNGGQTTHSACGLRPDGRQRVITNLDDYMDKLDARKLKALKDDWQGVVLLIIDEGSMVSASMLYAVHLRLNIIFGKQTEPGVYFGGLAVLIVGDLYQLKPVKAEYIFEDLYNCSINLFRLLFHPIFLTIIHRQQSDIPFMEVLSRIRIGTQTDDDIAFLQSLHVCLHSKRYNLLFKKVPHLFSTKKLVHDHNIKMVPPPESNIPIYLFRSTDRYTNSSDHVFGNHPDEPHLYFFFFFFFLWCSVMSRAIPPRPFTGPGSMLSPFFITLWSIMSRAIPPRPFTGPGLMHSPFFVVVR